MAELTGEQKATLLAIWHHAISLRYEQEDLDALVREGLITIPAGLGYDFNLTGAGLDVVNRIEGEELPSLPSLLDASIESVPAESFADAVPPAVSAEAAMASDTVLVRWWHNVPAVIPTPPSDAGRLLVDYRDELRALVESRDYFQEDEYALRLALDGAELAIEAVKAGESGDRSAMRDGLIGAKAFLSQCLVAIGAAILAPYIVDVVQPLHNLITSLLGL